MFLVIVFIYNRRVLIFKVTWKIEHNILTNKRSHKHRWDNLLISWGLWALRIPLVFIFWCYPEELKAWKLKIRCIIITAENISRVLCSLCKPSWGSPRGSLPSWRQSPWGRRSCSCTGSSCCPSRWCSWSRTSPSVSRTPPPRTRTHSSCSVQWRIKC